MITERYRALNAALHAAEPDYGGGAGRKYMKRLQALLDDYGTTDVLDYGCGKGTLARLFPCVRGYDPAVRQFAALPEPADLVICRDVLEHVEPDCLHDVLDHLRSLTRRAAVLTIATRPAANWLPDGRNTHVCLMPKAAWLDELAQRWPVVRVVNEQEGEFEVICETKGPT